MGEHAVETDGRQVQKDAAAAVAEPVDPQVRDETALRGEDRGVGGESGPDPAAPDKGGRQRVRQDPGEHLVDGPARHDEKCPRVAFQKRRAALRRPVSAGHGPTFPLPEAFSSLTSARTRPASGATGA